VLLGAVFDRPLTPSESEGEFAPSPRRGALGRGLTMLRDTFFVPKHAAKRMPPHTVI